MAGKAGCGNNIPKYTHKEEIIGLIDAYFKECEGELLRDAVGNPMLDKFQQPIFIGKKPPTVCGLALALGFRSRQSLLNYQAKKEFKDVIDEAKLRIEEYVERRLFDKDGANGAKFSLQCNFSRWSTEAEEGTGAPTVNIICDIPKNAPAPAPTEEKEEPAEEKADGKA